MCIRDRVEARTQQESELLVQEAEARGILYVNLDATNPKTLRGCKDAVPGLLYSDLVFGTDAALFQFEHRLPGDLEPVDRLTHRLPDWAAHHRAVHHGRDDEMCIRDRYTYSVVHSA